MNRWGNKALAIGLVCAGVGALLAAKRAAAVAADDPAAADKAVFAALSKGDLTAANKYLDPDFSWIDSEGIMWAKEDAFRAKLKPLIAGAGDAKIIEHKYGKSVV